jgi:hypothetical protein
MTKGDAYRLRAKTVARRMAKAEGSSGLVRRIVRIPDWSPRRQIARQSIHANTPIHAAAALRASGTTAAAITKVIRGSIQQSNKIIRTGTESRNIVPTTQPTFGSCGDKPEG